MYTNLDLGGLGGNPYYSSYGYGDPDQTMANILRGQQQFRNQIYTPLESDVISQIGDGSLVDAARDAAQQNLGGTAERATRMASRYGGLSSPLQAAELSRKAKLGDATAATGLVNNARIAQDERDQCPALAKLLTPRSVEKTQSLRRTRHVKHSKHKWSAVSPLLPLCWHSYYR
jgi:hypothetical protein